jgi:hypothetical protein
MATHPNMMLTRGRKKHLAIEVTTNPMGQLSRVPLCVMVATIPLGSVTYIGMRDVVVLGGRSRGKPSPLCIWVHGTRDLSLV